MVVPTASSASTTNREFTLSSFVMVRLAVLGAPNDAPVAPLNVSVTVSFGSIALSPIIVTVKVFAVASPDTQFNVPLLAV